jgi:hypothetical protein
MRAVREAVDALPVGSGYAANLHRILRRFVGLPWCDDDAFWSMLFPAALVTLDALDPPPAQAYTDATRRHISRCLVELRGATRVPQGLFVPQIAQPDYTNEAERQRLCDRCVLVTVIASMRFRRTLCHRGSA